MWCESVYIEKVVSIISSIILRKIRYYAVPTNQEVNICSNSKIKSLQQYSISDCIKVNLGHTQKIIIQLDKLFVNVEFYG